MRDRGRRPLPGSGMARHGQGQACMYFEEPQENEVGEYPVARHIGGALRQTQRNVGPRGTGYLSTPCRGMLLKGSRAEYAGPVHVGVDVVAHHLALPGVAVDVTTEHWRREENRDGPDHDDADNATYRHALMRTQLAEQTDPHSDHEDETGVDQDGGVHGRVSELYDPTEPSGPPGMPKNQAPGMWGS